MKRTALVVVVLVWVAWLALPWLTSSRRAIDAAPYVASAAFLPDHVEDVYPRDDGSNAPGFTAQACATYPDDDPCPAVAGFASAPPVLLATWPLRWLEPDDAISAVRLVTVATLLIPAFLLWRRLAVDEQGARIAAVTMLALTPSAVVVVALGQTSPLLMVLPFLAAESGRRKETVAGAVVGGLALLKVLPGGLVLAAAWQRRWRLVAAAVAVAVIPAAIAAVVLGRAAYTDWLNGLANHGALVARSPGNGSLEGLLSGVGRNPDAAWVLRAVLVVVLLRALAAVAHPGRAWVLATVALLVVSPQLWTHYLLAAVAAVAALAVGRERWAVAGAAAVCSIVNWLRGWLVIDSTAIRAATWLLPVAVFVWGFRRSRASAAARPEPIRPSAGRPGSG